MTEVFHYPGFWMMATLGAYLSGLTFYQRLGQPSFAPPVLTGFMLITAALLITDTSYEEYRHSGDMISFFLGPVVVALAIPLYQHLHTMKRQLLRIFLAITLGSATTVACAVLLTDYWIGVDAISNTMATKSITTPVAVALAEEMDAIPALAAAFVMITGILGAMMIPTMLKMVRMSDPQSTGVALGVCAHAVGTSRAAELGQEYAAYSAMAMTLTASLHAIILPWLL